MQEDWYILDNCVAARGHENIARSTLSGLYNLDVDELVQSEKSERKKKQPMI